MPKKITITDEDGTVTEITETQYSDILRNATAAILSSQEFKNELKGMVDKIGDELVKRLANVEKTATEQGEKIVRLEAKTDSLEKDLGKVRENFAGYKQEIDKQIAAVHLQASSQAKSQLFLSGKTTSPLDACPDPGNLKEEFRGLLAVKEKNKNQVVFGPVLSKSSGDGFYDKENMRPLDENEIADIIRDLKIEAMFVVTVTNAEKRMARVRFEGPNADAACRKVLSEWKKLRNTWAMWASPDQPVDLSKMIVNAKRFGIALRTDGNFPTTSYVDVRDGVLFIGSVRVIPVYLVPESEKWPLVTPIVVRHMKKIMSLPWTRRKAQGSMPEMSEEIWDAVWKEVNV
jgi:hypothetical protein